MLPAYLGPLFQVVDKELRGVVRQAQGARSLAFPRTIGALENVLVVFHCGQYHCFGRKLPNWVLPQKQAFSQDLKQMGLALELF